MVESHSEQFMSPSNTQTTVALPILKKTERVGERERERGGRMGQCVCASD